MSAQYCCPDVPANGTNKFLVDVENSRESTTEAAPGPTNAYVYYPEQRDLYGDHWFPDGTIIPFSSTPGNFGPSFVSRPNFTPQRNRWYSYELMVKANTPGSRDGRVALWIDGNLIADWQNIRLRDTTALKIERITLDLHIKHNPNRVNLKWYDNVKMLQEELSATEHNVGFARLFYNDIATKSNIGNYVWNPAWRVNPYVLSKS